MFTAQPDSLDIALGMLSSRAEQTGIPVNSEQANSALGGIIKDSRDEINPNLTQNEISRFRNIFTILGEVLQIGKFAPTPEAGTLELSETTKEGSSLPPTVSVVNQVKGNEDTTMGLLGKAFGIGLASFLLAEVLGPEGRFSITSLLKLPVVSVELGPKLAKATAEGGVTLASKLASMLGFTDEIADASKLADAGADASKSVSAFTKFSNSIKNLLGVADNVGEIAEVTGNIDEIAKATGVGANAIKSDGLLSRIAAGLGSKLLKAFRFLPVIGGLVNLGFAVWRFNKGETVAGIAELVAGILSLTSPFTGGIGAGASMLIDGMLLLYDLEKDEQGNVQILGQGGVLQRWTAALGEWLAPKLKYIPVVSTFIYWGEALGYALGGDAKSSLKSFWLGLLGFFAGKGGIDLAGWGAQKIADGFGFVMGLFETESLAIPTEPNTGGYKSFASIIWSKVQEMVSKTIEKMTQWIKDTYEAVLVVAGVGGEVDYSPSQAQVDVSTVQAQERTKKIKEKVRSLGFETPLEAAQAAGYETVNKWLIDNMPAPGTGRSQMLSEQPIAAPAPTASATQLVPAVNNIVVPTTPTVVLPADNSEQLNTSIEKQTDVQIRGTKAQINILTEIRDGLQALAVTSSGSKPSRGTSLGNSSSNVSPTTLMFRNEASLYTIPTVFNQPILT